ncbi:MAG: tetratricopeptide repeat protein [Gammaproteobacteria bacterium]|nr:tetratricopeptide repeat protein [Gammaproteobacteria bacterium]
MPKLTISQWIYVVVFLVMYGLAVHGLTRAHYERQAMLARVGSLTPSAPSAPAQAPDRLGASMQRFGPNLGPREELSTEDPILLARLGDQLFEQRQYARAVAAYERAVRFNPSDVDSYNDLGLVLQYLGRSAEALAVLKKGIAQDGTYQRIHLTLGFVQLQSGDTPAAVAALQRAIELDPESDVGQAASRMLAEAGVSGR